MYTACTYDAYRCANASESPLSLSLLYPANRNEEEKKGAVKIYSFDQDSPLSKERSEVSFFVREKEKKTTALCADTSLRAIAQFKNILSRNILADRVTGGLPQESSERFHFSFHPHSLSPPFLVAVHSSILPSFLTLPPSPPTKPYRDARRLKGLILRVGQPSRAMMRVPFWTHRRKEKDGESLLGDSFERE